MSGQTPTILKEILDHKVEEVKKREAQNSLQKVRGLAEKLSPPRGFIRALKQNIAQSLPAVIAEIKKASPSQGIIRENFNPVEIAQSYQLSGASCLSVLTDKKFFQGHEVYMQEARKACILPVLRKDFIIDAYQVYETRALGADCILLIVAAFLNDQEKLRSLVDLALSLQLDILLEVHTEYEMNIALQMPCRLIGINNRDLNTFKTDLDTTHRLKALVPKDRLLVTESGIHTREDAKIMQAQGINAFLVGEAFMRKANPGAALKQLFF